MHVSEISTKSCWIGRAIPPLLIRHIANGHRGLCPSLLPSLPLPPSLRAPLEAQPTESRLFRPQDSGQELWQPLFLLSQFISVKSRCFAASSAKPWGRRWHRHNGSFGISPALQNWIPLMSVDIRAGTEISCWRIFINVTHLLGVHTPR